MILKNWKSLPKQLFKCLFLFFGSLSSAYQGTKNYKATETPHPLRDLKVQEHLGDFINLHLPFINEKGKSLSLQSYFKNQPVLMTVVYYNCPSLCQFHLKGLFEGIHKMPLQLGEDYQFVILSMDSKETPSLARRKKANYLKKYKKLKGKGLHFLTGSSSSIQQLTRELGFPFRWDEETKQFAHSPVAYVLSSKGLISRYLYGVEFQPQTLKLSLVEGGEGKVGNILDRILLFCYRFNPRQNRYTLYAYNLMRAGGGLTVFLLLLFFISFWNKERRGKL